MSRDWTCCKSGDCCRDTDGVTVTQSELAAVRTQAGGITFGLVDAPGDDTRQHIVRVDGQRGCPFLVGNACAIYDVRPGVCRVYGCFRKSPSDPYRGMDGMLARFKDSAGVRRVALRMFDEAEEWTRLCASDACIE